MLKKRLISCLVLKDNLVVQSFGFRHYLPVGKPRIAVEFMQQWDVDEIVIQDISATPEGRSINVGLVTDVSKRCFVPLTVGGGIRTVADIRAAISAGADKVIINSAALNNPEFIGQASERFGSQCIVISIDVKADSIGKYRVYSDSGTKKWELSPIEWAREIEGLGAGELLVNSIDRDGAREGYDIELLMSVSDSVGIPVIGCGGVGKMSDFVEGIIKGGVSAVAAANIFHHIEHSTIIAKAYLRNAGVDVRINTLADYKECLFDGQGRIRKIDEAILEKIWFSKSNLPVV